MMSGLLFADNCIGLAENISALQKLIGNMHNYSKRWFEVNVKKVCCCIFFTSRQISGGCVWGCESLPVLDSYCYLGIEFSSNGSWDKHIKSPVVRNKQKSFFLPSLHNFTIDLIKNS